MRLPGDWSIKHCYGELAAFVSKGTGFTLKSTNSIVFRSLENIDRRHLLHEAHENQGFSSKTSCDVLEEMRDVMIELAFRRLPRSVTKALQTAMASEPVV